MRLGIVIPVYNAQATIESVLRRLSAEVLERAAEVLVIDNRSEDGTAAIVNALQSEDTVLARRLTLVRNQRNYGYGASIKIGFRYFIRHQFTHLIVLHGDDQTDADALVRRFLAEVDSDPRLDLVLASRFAPGSDTRDYSRMRRLGNHGFNWLTRLLTGLRLSDCGAALLLARIDRLAALPFDEITDGYQFHPQLNLLLFADRNLHWRELPLLWRDSPAGSALRIWHYAWYLLRILTSYAWFHRLLGQPAQAAFARLEKPVIPEFKISPRQA